jgi:hypothetical protein
MRRILSLILPYHEWLGGRNEGGERPNYSGANEFLGRAGVRSDCVRRKCVAGVDWRDKSTPEIRVSSRRRSSHPEAFGGLGTRMDFRSSATS